MKDTCDTWKEVFGDRFPAGIDKNETAGGQCHFEASTSKGESLYNTKKLMDSGTFRTAGAGIIGTTGMANLPHNFYGDEDVHPDQEA